MSSVPSSFLYVLLKNRKFLFRVLLVVMLVTVGITYLLTQKYTVKTVILPPDDQSSGGLSLGGLSLGEFAGFFSGGMGYSLPLMTTLSDVYVRILNSRTVVDNVILSMGYADSTGIAESRPNQPEVVLYLARKQFLKDYTARVGSSGFIEIEVRTKNPHYSIAISERVVFLLDSINTSITLARLVQNREISENRLTVANASLERTTVSLLSFEAEYGTIVPDREMEELMSVLADMKSRYVEANLTASAIRSGIRYGTTAQILELETQAEALRGAIEMLETGSSSEMGGVNLGPGIRNLPPALIEYARLKTDLEMQLKMVAALELQVGQAIIQEENIQSSIRILDPPLHPGWKSSPKRLFIWIQVFVIAFGFLSIYIFGRERWHTMREDNPDAWKKWDDLLQDVRGDFRRKGSKPGKG